MGLFQKINNPREICQKLGAQSGRVPAEDRRDIKSGGSPCHEAGRDMLKPVTELLRLVHLEGVDLEFGAQGKTFRSSSFCAATPGSFMLLRDAVADEGASVVVDFLICCPALDACQPDCASQHIAVTLR